MKWAHGQIRMRKFTPKVGRLKKLFYIACMSIALISTPDRNNINAKAGFYLNSIAYQGRSTEHGCTFPKHAEFMISGPTGIDRIWVKMKYPKIGSGTHAGTFFIRLMGYDHSGELIKCRICVNRRQPLIFPASWVVNPPAKISIEYVPFNMTDENCISEIGLQEI